MKYRFLLSLLAVIFTVTASAQESNNRYPHAFVGLQGGALQNYNGVSLDRRWDPMGAISVGYYFTDVFGLRLQGSGSQWNAKLSDDSEFKSKLGSVDLDVLLNLSNVFFPHRNNLVNVVAVAGVPLELAVPHTWVQNYAQNEIGSAKWNKGWKGGGMLEFNVSKHWGINLEGGVNYIRQENSAVSNNEKWWPYAMAGLTYKFGFKKARKPVEVAPVVTEEVQQKAEEPIMTPKLEPKPETKIVVKQEPAKTKDNLFFKIGRSAVTKEHAQKIDEIVQWAKEHPTAQIALSGYADKGTGTARLNQALSERRAAAVKDALVKKGIAADRITTEAFGDTVQPFAENNDNRVVIMIGEEK